MGLHVRAERRLKRATALDRRWEGVQSRFANYNLSDERRQELQQHCDSFSSDATVAQLAATTANVGSHGHIHGTSCCANRHSCLVPLGCLEP